MPDKIDINRITETIYIYDVSIISRLTDCQHNSRETKD